MTERKVAPDGPGNTPLVDSATSSLLDELGRAAWSIGRQERTPTPRYCLEFIALFDRVRSAFAASLTLVESGYVHEAVTLGRGMFTDSLILAEAASVSTSQRMALALGWEARGLADYEGILKQCAANGDDVSADLAAVQRHRQRLFQYAERHNVKVRSWTPSEKTLAERHGRAPEYIDFRLTHHFVHGSALATRQRYKKDGDTVVVGGQAVTTTAWAIPCLLFAALSLLHSIRALCRILAVETPPGLDAFEGRIDEVLADHRARSTET